MTKVTDEQVEAACEAYEDFSMDVPNSKAMRAALESALSRQGRVVSVEKLEALQAQFIDWRYEELEPCEWRSDHGTVVILLDDLRALIGEDHG